MPTYEYRCRDCGHTFDVVQKMTDDPLTGCPNCGGELRKVFAPPAIAFKGSGFYATDHGKRSKTSTGATDADASGTDGKDTKKGSSEGSSAKKPETKSGSSSSGAKESS